MGKQPLKSWLKDIVALISWKVFLRAIGMTQEDYWREVYKSERNKRCIDTEAKRAQESEKEKMFNISHEV
jgi:hypothetical protein